LQKLFKKNHKKIGILGGTFDPAHIGHINISREAKKKFKLDYIIWAITKKNPFKKKSNLDLNSRIKFARKITKKNKFIKIQFYEECLADQELKNIGEKLRKQLLSLIYLNKKLIPTHILEQRKSYRESIRIRNTYAETLNLLQADIMRKLNKNSLKGKNKKILKDAMLVTIAGISAAMKNTG